MLSLALVLGLMPGMSLTAYAEVSSIPYTFNATSTSDGNWQYNFPLESGQIQKIKKIEVLIDMEKIVEEGGWGQVQWGKNGKTQQTPFNNVPGIAKYSVGGCHVRCRVRYCSARWFR